MTIKESALEYIKLGMSIIPIRGPAYTFGTDFKEKYNVSKTPLLKTWEEYQKRQPTVEEVEGWFNTWPDANIAIITGKISDAVVIDCDSDEAIAFFKENYQGQTVSAKGKRGYHYYFQYESDVSCASKLFGINLDVRSEGGYIIAPPSRIYTNGSEEQQYYKWENSILNEGIDKDALKSLSFSLYKGVVESGYAKQNNSTRFDKIRQDSTKYFIEGRRDEDLFHVANSLIKGGCNPVIIRHILEITAKNCNPPFPEKDIDSKIKSAIDRADKKETNMMQEVGEFIYSTTGVFYSTEIANILHYSTTKELKNLSVILKRYCKQGLIEKTGTKNGCWRRVDNDIEIIDWKNASDEEYPARFPLQLEKLIKLYPGNVVVLAGASNSGKTSFVLETIRLNMHKHKVLYANSEMAAQELRIRLSSFHSDMVKFDEWNFQAIERSSNFADVINPDGFNIIDYMEVYDDFWKVGGWIRDIHTKLKSGIAIIVIQKKSSTKKESNKYGRGGELTIEKPRLYLAMDRGRIEIIKAKIWRDHGINPNGMVRNFKLAGGWKFIPQGDWYNADEEKYTEAGFTHEED